MLNADAAVFIPKSYKGQDPKVKSPKTGPQKEKDQCSTPTSSVEDDGSSTCVPSPALTYVIGNMGDWSASPWASPGFQPMMPPLMMPPLGMSPYMVWSPMMYNHAGMPMQMPDGLDDFSLPENGETEGDEVAFELEGFEDEMKVEDCDEDAQGVSDDEVAQTPNIFFRPPPGLALPEGLEELVIKLAAEMYPGLEVAGKLSDGTSTPESPPKSEASPIIAPRSEPVRHVRVELPEGCTTVMLRNIPNKYTRDMLWNQLEKVGFGKDIDFLYVPIDFRNKCNVGYAFLNFRSEWGCIRFADQFHSKKSADKLPGFRSTKVCEVSPARCQGREENVERLQASQVMVDLQDKPEWQPLLIDHDGKPEPFAVPKATYRRRAM